MKKVLSLILALMMLLTLAPMAMADAAPMTISVAGYMFGPIDDAKDVITPAVEARLKEAHGIDVDIQVQYIEYSEYAEILNTRLAGGSAPDVFLSQSHQTVQTYYDQGVIAGWDVEFFKENAPDVYNFIQAGTVDGRLAADVEMWNEYAHVDGKMVTVPKIVEDGSMPYKTLMYRGDWLEKLGVTEENLPKTVDEFVDLMYRFTNEDPDGDGVADTYGMSATGVKALFGAYGMFNGFVGGTSYWMVDDGKIINPDIHEDSKKVVEILAKMYADGVIDPEFVTGKESISGSYWAISNGFVNARYGASALASIDHYRTPDILNDAGGPCAQEYYAVNGADAKFVYAPWPAGPEGEFGYSVGYAVSNGENAVYNAALEQDTEKLATIFKIMNAFATDDELYILASWGIEGEHYTKGEDGKMLRNPDMTNADFNAVGIWGCRSLYGSDRAVSETGYNLAFYNDVTIANRLSWFDKPQYTSYIKDAVTTVLPSSSDLKAELNTLRDETYIAMIKGERSIDTWDEYVEEYLELGGQTLADEANEWYASK